MILIAGRTIEWEAHGETYANKNPDFAISADGNLCNQNPFGGSAITSKYQGNPTLTLSAVEYDRNPTGGFGGMGLVVVASALVMGHRTSSRPVIDAT